MTLTGKAKQDFEDWYTARTPSAHTLLLVHFYNKGEIEQFAWYIEWFDSVELFINIEPHIGGGACVFFARVSYWLPNGIDTIIHNVTNYNYDNILYFSTRQEATEAAIIKANEIYNNEKRSD